MRATVAVAFDHDHEGGEVAVADDLPKLPLDSVVFVLVLGLRGERLDQRA
jgi:hypothetical protein